MNVDLGVQPESRTLDEWSTELAARSDPSEERWRNALMRSVRRGTVGVFTESSAPRVPRILRTEVDDWLALRFHDDDFDAPGLPDPPKPPKHHPGYHSREAAVSRHGRPR